MSRKINYDEQFNSIEGIEKQAEELLSRYYVKAFKQINEELKNVQSQLEQHKRDLDYAINNMPEGKERDEAIRFWRQQVYHRTDVQNRLLALRKKIDEVVTKLVEDTALKVIDTTDKTYQETYYRYAYLYDKDIGYMLDWTQLPEDTIKTSFQNSVASLVNYKDDGSNIYSKTGSWTDKEYKYAKYYINEEITTGIIQGKSIQQMAAGISERIKQSYGRALRISRTETMRAHNEAHNRVWQEMKDQGIDRVKFWRHRPFRVGDRDNHKAMQDKPADEKGFFYLQHGNSIITTQAPGQTGYADEDIHCHCIFYTVDKDDINLNLEGKYPAFEKGDTYESWRKKLIESKKNEYSNHKVYYENIKTSGTVELDKGELNKKEKEFDDNYEVAKILANNGYKVKLINRSNEKGVKSADAVLNDNEKWEIKTNKTASFSAIDKCLRTAALQADRVILNIKSDIDDKLLYKALKNRVRQKTNILEIILIKNNSMQLLSRKDIINLK